MAVPPTSAAFCLAALLAAAGCAGGPSLARVVTVQEGSPTTARLVNIRGGARQVFTLRNESAAATGEEGGGRERFEPLTKQVPDEVLQEILDYFAELGLFAGAGPDFPAGASSAILVDSAGQRFALHAGGASVERKQAYARAYALYLNVFNHASGYQKRDVRDSNSDGSLERTRSLKEVLRGTSGGQDR